MFATVQCIYYVQMVGTLLCMANAWTEHSCVVCAYAAYTQLLPPKEYNIPFSTPTAPAIYFYNTSIIRRLVWGLPETYYVSTPVWPFRFPSSSLAAGVNIARACSWKPRILLKFPVDRSHNNENLSRHKAEWWYTEARDWACLDRSI